MYNLNCKCTIIDCRFTKIDVKFLNWRNRQCMPCTFVASSVAEKTETRFGVAEIPVTGRGSVWVASVT